MPVVSVIVPVYNVEKYLVRCVKSICQQTLRDLEIILVNDGSPDNCGNMCNQFAREDSRIKVVHKQNGGLSSARNAGLRIATGTYVGFVDSDDTIEPEMYERFVGIMEQNPVDFCMSDYIRVGRNGDKSMKTTEIQGGLYDRARMVKDIFPQLIMKESIDYGPLLSVWHCIYRLDFLREQGIEFDEQVRWSEDNIFSALVGHKAKKFYYIKNQGWYHYYENKGSITTGYRKGCWQVYKIMNEHLHDYFDSVQDYDFSDQLKYHLLYYACNSLGQVPRSGENWNKQVAMIREIMSDEALNNAFCRLKFPNAWKRKMKIQIGLIKYKMALLYRITVLR